MSWRKENQQGLSGEIKAADLAEEHRFQCRKWNHQLWEAKMESQEPGVVMEGWVQEREEWCHMDIKHRKWVGREKKKKRSDSQNRLEGRKPRYSQHGSGCSWGAAGGAEFCRNYHRGGQVHSQPWREGAAFGGSQAQGTGHPGTAFTCSCPLEKEQKCQWR